MPHQELFERFVSSANPPGLEPNDVARLFDYIIAVHRADDAADTDELRRMMAARSFDDETVAHVIGAVELGLPLLEQYDHLGGASRADRS